MAKTEYGVNHEQTVKAWSKVLSVEALKRTTFYNLISNKPYGAVQMKDELQKGRGDKITFGLRMQFTGAGRQGAEVQEGHEEALTVYSDSVVIDTLRHAARSDSDSSISQQRVPFNIRDEMLDGLADWWADRWDEALMNQLCGYTVQTDTRYTGNQSVTAPDSDHILRQNSRANDQSLVAGDEFTLDLINKAVEKAKTLTPPIRKVDLGNGMKKYILIIHPYQETSLRTDAATAGNWFDIQQARIQGGDVTGNPIFTDALGVYNDTVILCNTRVTPGVDGSDDTEEDDVRRAVFLGAQSAVLAFGQNNGVGRLSWTEKFFDYEEQLGVQAKSIFGLKATRFNSKDYGKIVLPTYAVAAS